MIERPSRARLAFIVACAIIAIGTAFVVEESRRLTIERSYGDTLAIEAKRRAIGITAQTLNGNVMGSAASLGLVDRSIRSVVEGKSPVDDPVVSSKLRAVGTSYRASGVFLVGTDGIVQTSWDRDGRSSTGIDVRFRPYFQIAMQGKQNVYAAVSLSTGERAIYFAAPVFNEPSSAAPVIGAMVVRLDLEQIDAALNEWSGPALLLSPQGVTFASNRPQWNTSLAHDMGQDELQAIRELKQFGAVFETGKPTILPVDVRRAIVTWEGRRYAVNAAPVQWNDPNGDWTLVLLGDLDALMPLGQKSLYGGAGGAVVLLAGAVVLAWRRRLHQVEEKRQHAERALQRHVEGLHVDSAAKEFLAEMSADLHQATSIAEFGRRFFLRLMPQIEAQYGAFYVLDEEQQRLVPMCGHGIVADTLETIGCGQGLIGQCAKDRTPIFIDDSKETDIRIVWGAGAMAPRSIAFVPIVQLDQTLGVIVLAALQPFDQPKRAMLDTTVAVAGVSLGVLLRNLQTQRQGEAMKSAQRELQETEAWYRGIIESLPDGLLIIDEHGVIILANPQLEALFGYPAGALVGETMDILVPAAIRPRHPKLRDSFYATGSTRRMGGLATELRGVRRDGSEFPVEIGLSILPAFGTHGRCVCASVRAEAPVGLTEIRPAAGVA